MKEFSYTIKDELGIHARPAGLLVKEATKFSSEVKLKKDDKEVDAKRIIGVMSLGTKQGETVTVTANGDDEEQAITAIKEFMENNL